MKISFRQGIVSHQTGAFLQLSGNSVNILAQNRPVVITLAHKNTNYTYSEDQSVVAAWTVPLTATRYWLYWDFNKLTFQRTFGYTTLEPVAQSAVPGSGNAVILGVTPGTAGVGSFLVNKYYNLAIGRTFAVINSTGNDGTYTVKSIDYNTSTGKTTIGVEENVASSVVDGEATLDIDSQGIPLYTTGRHWFNTITNEHFVLSGSSWLPVLRVFSALLYNGTTLISMSQNAPSSNFIGTQIGNNNTVSAGRVLFDEASQPVRRDDGTFFTTEDQFFANQSQVNAIRLESNVIRAQCVPSALSKFSVVAWKADGKISDAKYDDVENTIVGILTEDLVSYQIGAVVVQGSITNPDWDWLSETTIGGKLWVKNGQLVSVDPHESDPINYPYIRVPIARVLSTDTVIFEQGLGGVGPPGPSGAAGGIIPATTTDLGGCTLVTPSTNPLRSYVISDTDPRLTDARTPLSHTHQASSITFQPDGGVVATDIQAAIAELGNGKLNKSGGTMTGALILSADPTISLHPATKQYVDNLVIGLTWIDPIKHVNLISNTLTTPPGTPYFSDIYIPATGSTGAWSGLDGHVLQYDGSSWIDLGLLSAYSTGSRFGIAMETTSTPSGSFSGKADYIAVLDNPATASWSFIAPVNNTAVYVNNATSLHAYHQYVYNNIQWVEFSGTQSLGASSIKDLGDVYSSMVPTNGQVLTYNTTNGWQSETFVIDIVNDTTPQLGGNLDLNGNSILCADNIVERPLIKDYAISHSTLSSTAGAVTIDCSVSNSFAITLTENITSISIVNPPASGRYGQLRIRITQGAGAYTVTWPASVKWPGATAPVISIAAGAIDLIILETDDAGTNYFGNFNQGYA